jgi:transcription antitermination factor NusG
MICWHALHVKHQCEAIVAEFLEGLDTFWPHRISHDNRKREIRRPWFPGYLFVRVDWDDPVQRIRILRVSQLLAILAVDGKPCVIPESEIESLRILASSKARVSQHPYLQIGESVRVVRGPLAGVEGKVMRLKSAALLVVQVEMLQRAVSVELDPDTIEAVARRPLQSAA